MSIDFYFPITCFLEQILMLGIVILTYKLLNYLVMRVVLWSKIHEEDDFTNFLNVWTHRFLTFWINYRLLTAEYEDSTSHIVVVLSLWVVCRTLWLKCSMLPINSRSKVLNANSKSLNICLSSITWTSPGVRNRFPHQFHFILREAYPITVALGSSLNPNFFSFFHLRTTIPYISGKDWKSNMFKFNNL